MLSEAIQRQQIITADSRPLVPAQRTSDAFTAYAAVHELGRSLQASDD